MIYRFLNYWGIVSVPLGMLDSIEEAVFGRPKKTGRLVLWIPNAIAILALILCWSGLGTVWAGIALAASFFGMFVASSLILSNPVPWIKLLYGSQILWWPLVGAFAVAQPVIFPSCRDNLNSYIQAWRTARLLDTTPTQGHDFGFSGSPKAPPFHQIYQELSKAVDGGQQALPVRQLFDLMSYSTLRARNRDYLARYSRIPPYSVGYIQSLDQHIFIGSSQMYGGIDKDIPQLLRMIGDFDLENMGLDPVVGNIFKIRTIRYHREFWENLGFQDGDIFCILTFIHDEEDYRLLHFTKLNLRERADLLELIKANSSYSGVCIQIRRGDENLQRWYIAWS